MMKTRIRLVLFFSIFCVLSTKGQDFLGIIAGDNLVKETIGKSIVTMEQSYHLKDAKGNVYGLDNKTSFGTVYSLGIVTEGGFIVDDKVLHPWNYDPNYEEYRNNRNYAPVWHGTSIKPFGNNEFSKIDCEERVYEELFKDRFLLSCVSKGLRVSDTTGKVNGWMVWVMHPSQSEISKDLNYNVYVVYTQDVEVKNNEFTVRPPQNTQMTIGGFFIVPNITSIGSVTFELCGMVYKEGLDWKLFSLVQEKKKAEENKPEASKEGEETPKPASGGKLTPIVKEKKGNKK